MREFEFQVFKLLFKRKLKSIEWKMPFGVLSVDTT